MVLGAMPVAAETQLAVSAPAVVSQTQGNGVNIRATASRTGQILGTIPEGTQVQLIGGPNQARDGSAWYPVDASGTQGWIISTYLAQPTSASTTPSRGQQIAANALKYLGSPYTWGGTTLAGFDCSGFVYYVVKQITGGSLPRSLTGQATSGSPLDPHELQPGDLVFFQNTYQPGLSHAGIYVGHGQFINAANESTGVILSNLWDSYWGPGFETARRIG
jgi:cell wall-associated NlpC family hydrolase